MSQKTLSIIVKAVDSATAPLRRVTGELVNVGDKSSVASSRMAKSIDLINSKLTGLMAVVVGFASLAAARALLGGMVRSFDEVTRTLDDVGNTADRLRIPIKMLSELRYAAKINELEFSALADGVKTAETNIAMFATTGGGKAADSIRRLGLSLRNSEGRIRDMGELLPEIFDKVKALPEAEQGLVTQKLFGAGADNLLFLIRQGGAEFRRMGEEARRMGVVFTPAQVRAAQVYRDALDRLGEAWTGLRANLVERFAPALTMIVDKISVFMAAVPEMIAKMSKTLGDALSDRGGAGDAARFKIEVLLTRITALVVTSVKGMIRISAATLAAGIPAVVELVYPVFKAGANRIAEGLMNDVVLPFFFGNEMDLFKQFTGKDPFKPIKASNAELQQGIAASMETLNAAMASQDSNLGLYGQAWSQTSDEIYHAGATVVEAVGQIVGMTEALANHAIPKLEEVQGLVAGPPPAAPGVWSRFFDAIGRGVENVRSRMLSAVDLVTDITERVIDQFSSSMATAIIDSIAGVKSFGEAVRDVASQVLRMIAQMITQWLIMKAIMGIAGSFGGGGGGGANDFIGPLPIGANRGGYMGRRGLAAAGMGLAAAGASIPRYSSGAYVPGGGVNTDSVLALLTTREGVLNRAATARAGGKAAIDYANRGGTLAPAGGGGAMVVNITINAGGGGAGGAGGGSGGTDLVAIAKAAEAGVLRALETKPGYKARVKAALT